MIRVLSDQTINQIAAGEVVENAASVVKELVDNALDSGASEIRIWIKAGGRALVRVADNGSGMSKDEALLALKRHATSKITSAEDLLSIETMGFRGEALPSIAAVSKLTLLTNDTEIVVNGGRVIETKPAARPQGTTVTVEDLFYNVPARRKFQKSISADVAQIHRLMTQLALANPNVRFQLFNEEEEILATSHQDLELRIEEVLGKLDLVPCKPELPPIRICGREGLGWTISDRDEANSRCTIDEERSEIGRQAPSDPKICIGGNSGCNYGFLGRPHTHRPNRLGQYLFINGRPVTCPEISEAIREGFGTRIPQGRHPVFILHLQLSGQEVDVNVHPQKREVRLSNPEALRQELIAMVNRAFQPKSTPAPAITACEPMAFDFHTPAPEQEPILFQKPIHILGELSDYILVDGSTLPTPEEGLILVHKKRALGRILYEQMLEPSTASQLLLAPITIEGTHIPELNEMGFQTRPFGPRSFIVEGIPPILTPAEVEPLLSELISGSKEKLALAAAKAVRPARSDPQALVTALFNCQIPDRSPQGKSTYIHVSFKSIQEKFNE